MGERVLERVFTPGRVFALLGVLAVLAFLISPEPQAGEENTNLSSYSPERGGARGLYNVLDRLGWKVERRTRGFREPLDSARVYLVLDPPIMVTTAEVHNLLSAVRAGASLLVVPVRHSPLAESLHVAQSPPHALTVAGDSGVSSFADSVGRAAELPDIRHHLVLGSSDTTLRVELPHDTVTFLATKNDSAGSKTNRRDPVMLGIPLGRGRIVALAEPRLLRNKYVRDGDAAVLAVRLMEWLAPARDRITLSFDEYHQGYGKHGSISGALRRMLVHTTPGRVLAQLLIAGLVLLVALSIRPMLPRARTRVERRSPLEHVGALARAYEQIEATQLATRRLVRGLRRRHSYTSHGSENDAGYLAAIAGRYPALRDDVNLLLAASQRPSAPSDFVAVGRAIESIERTVAP